MKEFVDLCRFYHKETLRLWMKEELLYRFRDILHHADLIPFLTRYCEHDLALLVLQAQLSDKTRYDCWYWHSMMRLIRNANKGLYCHLPGEYSFFYIGKHAQEFQTRDFNVTEIEELRHYLGDFFFIYYFRHTHYLTEAQSLLLDAHHDLFKNVHTDMQSNDVLLEVKKGIYRFDDYIHMFMDKPSHPSEEKLLL